MKIEAENAIQFVRHLDVIKKLSGCEHPYPFDIFERLRNIERKAHSLAERDCNGTITETQSEKQTATIEKRVKELLPNVKTFFINCDPRGYALKIKESEAKELGMYQDWGGYGILAPDF